MLVFSDSENGRTQGSFMKRIHARVFLGTDARNQDAAARNGLLLEEIELQAKLLNYFLGSNKSNINQATDARKVWGKSRMRTTYILDARNLFNPSKKSVRTKTPDFYPDMSRCVKYKKPREGVGVGFCHSCHTRTVRIHQYWFDKTKQHTLSVKMRQKHLVFLEYPRDKGRKPERKETRHACNV